MIAPRKRIKSDCRKAIFRHFLITNIDGETEERYHIQAPLEVQDFWFMRNTIVPQINLNGRVPTLGDIKLEIFITERDEPRFYRRIFNLLKKKRIPLQEKITEIQSYFPRLWVKGQFSFMRQKWFDHDSNFDPPLTIFFDQKKVCPKKREK